MASPSTSLRVLCAGIATTVVWATVLMGASTPALAAAHAEPYQEAQNRAQDRAHQHVKVTDSSPLRVQIDYLSPSYVPEKGRVEVRGSLTNRDDETWSRIRLYTFFGEDLPPMRSPSALADAMDVPLDAYVGPRNVGPDDIATIDSLEPGESRSFVVTVPVSELEVTGGGVYWFGVHALGESASSPSDGLTDGRARTFLPYVPPRFQDDSLPTALVVPITCALPFESDGSLGHLPEWERALRPGGRLNNLLDFVAGSNAGPVTWAVDPALLDAVGRLARGNPPRSLGPTDRPAESPTATPSPTEATSGTSDQTEPLDAETSPGAAAASRWLDQLPDALGDNQVLTLPYGNLDVAGALHRDPALYELAVAQKSQVLQSLGVDTTPVVAAPGGYLDAKSIADVGPDSTVLVSDQVFGDQAPTVAKVGEQRVVVTSAGSSEGGPGPGRAITSLGLRQRILSEAAVRVIKDDREPLVVVLPTQWSLDDAAGFFAGLDVGWLGLDTVEEISVSEPGRVVSPDDLAYPPREQRRELDGQTFDAVDALIESGDTLQSLLTRNFAVGGQITEQALAGASYAVRKTERAGRASINRSRDWVDGLLGSVEISAPRGVTLSSTTGSFAATINNRLDEPVTVSVVAESDSGLEVLSPEPLTLAAHSRSPVLLEARVSSNRVYNVTLQVTDADGRPLGSTDELPIRSAQVSDVIWLIMGTGAGLLFLAIALRLVRRIRTARRGSPDRPRGPATPDTPEPADAT